MRNRFPPPGSNERSRDPPPDPLTDGALEGAVGASGPTPSASAAPREQPFEASHGTEKGALDSDEVGADLVALGCDGGVRQRRHATGDLVQRRGDRGQLGQLGRSGAFWCHAAIIADPRPWPGQVPHQALKDIVGTLRSCFDPLTSDPARPNGRARSRALIWVPKDLLPR